jgi:hypothetical protein
MASTNLQSILGARLKLIPAGSNAPREPRTSSPDLPRPPAPNSLVIPYLISLAVVERPLSSGQSLSELEYLVYWAEGLVNRPAEVVLVYGEPGSQSSGWRARTRWGFILLDQHTVRG